MAAAASEGKVDSYLRAVLASFAEGKDEVTEAFALIAERVRNATASLAFRLLAMRRYLRMGGERVVAQWAWTAEQTRLETTGGSAKAMYDLAIRVQEIFAQQNPGYRLQISPLRSLERQVELWTLNTSVQEAGNRLLTEMRELLAADQFPNAPDLEATRRFRMALRGARVQPEPTSAAPGTSDHGQGTAVDFVVVQGGRSVAGTRSAEIRSRWKRDGWEDRLMAAINVCNQEQLKKPLRPAPQLSGPLKKPYEPWHWVLKYAGPRS